jgi:hypothetical protein
MQVSKEELQDKNLFYSHNKKGILALFLTEVIILTCVILTSIPTS